MACDTTKVLFMLPEKKRPVTFFVGLIRLLTDREVDLVATLNLCALLLEIE